MRCSRRWARLSRSFLRGEGGADDALLSYLSTVMVRHLKADIDVPRPIRMTTRLECSAGERLAYNTLVSFLRANLVLTAMRGAESGAGSDVSLLHHTNLRSARTAIENLRLTCNGGGRQVATLSAEFYAEARDWMAQRYRAPPGAVERAERFMDRAKSGVPTPCDCCELPLLLLLIFPSCGHLVCPQCVTADTTACPVCAVPLPALDYLKCERCEDVHCAHAAPRHPFQAHPLDAFAYVQPGFELQWAETIREVEARALAEAFARERRDEQRRGGPTPGVPRAAIAATDAGGGGGGGGGGGPLVPAVPAVPAAARSTGYEHTKAMHIVERIAALRREERAAAEAAAAGRPLPRRDTRPIRVAVYSESRKTLDQLGHWLYIRFGDDAIAQFWGKYRSSELDKFRSGRVRSWRCLACPPRNDALGAAPEGREVEFPELRCYGKHLTVQLHETVGSVGGGGIGGGADGVGGEESATAAPSPRRVLVNEEDVREYTAGVVWSVGQTVQVRPRGPDGTLGPWRSGTLVKWGKCGAQMGRETPWNSRRSDCFVLLLTRDGSHGLDLSMLTHLFLADQCVCGACARCPPPPAHPAATPWGCAPPPRPPPLAGASILPSSSR